MSGEKRLYTPEFFIAWESFLTEVTRAFEAEDTEGEDRPLSLQQIRYVHANMAIAKLLRDLGDRETASKFHLLAEAIHDLAEGNTHPLLKVEKTKGGRQADISAVWRLRASVCISLKFMIAGGVTDQIAIESAAKRHRDKLSKLQRPGTDLVSNLGGWLKKFSADDVSNEMALSAYREGMQLLTLYRAERTGDQIKKAGDDMLAKAADEAAALA
jgi:hypothetical protein